MSDFQPPAGFKLFPLDNSFNDAFAPLYMAIDERGPRIGMRVEKQHLNPMGIMHGAVYMALLDIAFAAVIGHSLWVLLVRTDFPRYLGYLRTPGIQQARALFASG